MNEIQSFVKKRRNQTLVLVEGEHEKNVLLKILLRSFPEMSIAMENVHVYRTNIYRLYRMIQAEYGEEWYELEEGIDIPYLVGKYIDPDVEFDGRNFTNIILMFDYERQDPEYTKEKIEQLQTHFSKDNSDGRLYISYPMIEAYQHFTRIPDEEYMDTQFTVRELNAGGYKKMVNSVSYIRRYMNFFEKTLQNLRQYINTYTEIQIEELVYQLLSLSCAETLKEDIGSILEKVPLKDEGRDRVVNNLFYAIKDMGYISHGINFWTKCREIFTYIAIQSIRKGWKIQNTDSSDAGNDLKNQYENMDFLKILQEQSLVSDDYEKGFMWVLSTCMCLLGEYKFFWQS